MRSVAIVVEGRTEERFVEEILQVFVGNDVWLRPIVAHTKRIAGRKAKRGGAAWTHYRSHLRSLCSQPQWWAVTTLIDLYGFPADIQLAESLGTSGGHAAAAQLCEVMAREIGDTRFLPFVMVHEFEALVIAAGARLPSVFGKARAAHEFQKLLAEHDGNAELIDSHPHSSPAARVEGIIAEYSKVRDGIDIIERAGLRSCLHACPQLAEWIEWLRG